MTREEFERAAGVAMEHLLTSLQTYVDAVPEPRELVVMVFIDAVDDMSFAPSTRADILAKLVAANPSHREIEQIRAKAWPQIPVVFVHQEPGGSQWIQTASAISAPHSVKGGDA